LLKVEMVDDMQRECVMYVIHASLAGATNSAVCQLCVAGSYGSVSGEWLGMGARWGITSVTFMHLKGSR
jgi:hypothetical protein